MTINGTSGDDTLTGTSGNDIFNLGQGGDDTVSGLGGNDTFRYGATFTAADHVDGGTGNDTVELSGDYSAGLTLGAGTITSVETIAVEAGFSYKLTLNDANIASGARLSINASALSDSSDTLTVDGSQETDGTLYITGGAGNDSFTMGAELTAADRINGGTGEFGGGDDALLLGGNYALTFNANTLRNIADLVLSGGGYSYHFTTNDATLGGGDTMTVDGSALGAGNSLVFNGSHETDGNFTFDGGAGTMDLTGGEGGDIFNMGANLTNTDRLNGYSGGDALYIGGADYTISFKAATLHNINNFALGAGYDYHIVTSGTTIPTLSMGIVDGSGLGAGDSEYFNAAKETADYLFYAGAGPTTLIGGSGDDNFTFNIHPGDMLTAADHITGGPGNGGDDAINIDGDYTGANALVFSATTLTNIKGIFLGDSGASDAYDITTNDATVAAGQTLAIIGINLTSSQPFTFNGSAETNGHFYISSGADSDTLTGGALSDTFFYQAGIGTDGAERDTIHAFDFANDIVQFADVAGIAAAFSVGSVNRASIDADLTNIVNSTRLPAHDAVLYTAKTGNLAGHVFLIVDGNGVAGYQTGSDLVIELSGALHTTSISTANFN